MIYKATLGYKSNQCLVTLVNNMKSFEELSLRILGECHIFYFSDLKNNEIKEIPDNFLNNLPNLTVL